MTTSVRYGDFSAIYGSFLEKKSLQALKEKPPSASTFTRSEGPCRLLQLWFVFDVFLHDYVQICVFLINKVIFWLSGLLFLELL
jgi:hypothetical protein